MRTFVGWYAIGIGLLMLGWWIVDVRTGALDRPDRTSTEMGLHLAAEAATSLALMAGGTLLLMTGDAGLALVALGMLLYTVVQSPGYFLARREYGPAVMFAALIVVTVVAIEGTLRQVPTTG